MTLSEATIRAQQALSERFGIPTFNQSGGISTVPVLRTLTNTNVGTGRFTGDSVQSFTATLRENIGTLKQKGGSIGNTNFTRRPSPAPKASSTQTNDSVNTNFSDIFSEGLDSTTEFLSKNPSLLIAGAALIGLMVLKR